jgi:RNA 3'-terminal phosphate cyclase (ATP)
LGPSVALKLERYGFYPAGGGSFNVTIEPCTLLSPVQLVERGDIVHRRAVAVVANLPRGIAQREIDTVAKMLNWEAGQLEIIETKKSVGPGNIVLIEIGTAAGVTEVFCGFGRVGTAAESVATEAAKEARGYLASNAVAGEHLADQLLLPFALAGAGAFTAVRLNRHARTNMEVISSFLPVEFETAQEKACVRIEVKRKS